MPNLQTRLIWAASETLRPIVRRLLEMGVPFGALEISLRDLFVRVAESELAAPGRRQTDSRIALVTGINRKEVKRIRSARPQRMTRKTVAEWHGRACGCVCRTGLATA